MTAAAVVIDQFEQLQQQVPDIVELSEQEVSGHRRVNEGWRMLEDGSRARSCPHSLSIR